MTAIIEQARMIRSTPLCHVDEPTLLLIIDGLLAEIETRDRQISQYLRLHKRLPLDSLQERLKNIPSGVNPYGLTDP